MLPLEAMSIVVLGKYKQKPQIQYSITTLSVICTGSEWRAEDAFIQGTFSAERFCAS